MDRKGQENKGGRKVDLRHPSESFSGDESHDGAKIDGFSAELESAQFIHVHRSWRHKWYCCILLLSARSSQPKAACKELCETNYVDVL